VIIILITKLERKLFFPLIIINLLISIAIYLYDPKGYERVIELLIYLLIDLLCLFIYIVNPWWNSLYYNKGKTIQKLLLLLSIFTWLVLYISHELYAAVIFILYLGFFFSFIYNTIEDEYKLSLKKIKIGAITTTIAYVSFMAIFLDLENSLYLFILSLIPAFFVIITLYYEQKHVNMDPEEKFGTDEGYKWSLGIESLFGIILVLLIMIMSLGSYTVDILEGQDQTKTFQRDNISFTYPSEWFEEYNPEGFYFIFESVDGGAFGMEILINNH